jgi:hypothetical protein
MAEEQLSDSEALDLLLGKLEERAPYLAMRLKNAIDLGYEIEEPKAKKGDKEIKTKKIVKLSNKDALKVCVDSLMLHLVEKPRMVNAALRIFSECALDDHKPGYSVIYEEDLSKYFPNEEVILKEKLAIKMEIQTERQISKSEIDTLEFTITPENIIKNKADDIQKLSIILDLGN